MVGNRHRLQQAYEEMQDSTDSVNVRLARVDAKLEALSYADTQMRESTREALLDIKSSLNSLRSEVADIKRDMSTFRGKLAMFIGGITVLSFFIVNIDRIKGIFR